MQNKTPSPLFNAPWVKVRIFRRDWLHASDQGVAADFAGNCLKLLCTTFPAATIKARVQELFDDICAWYVREGVPHSSRLPCLTQGMVKSRGKAPKLRANAGTVRAIIPYLREATLVRLNGGHVLHAAVQQAATDLAECYDALRKDNIFHAFVLQRHSRLFALQYVALSNAHVGTKNWKLKPKLHLWLELCLEGGRPACFWTYRDEDYGGGVARMAHRRGARASVAALSVQVLESFRVKQPILRIGVS